MKCDIFIPIRLGNSRLPGKALKECKGKPLIFFLLERLRKCKKIRNLVICTTTNKTDDVLVNVLLKNNIKYFRGSEIDILQRFYDASKFYKPDFIVNVDGDDIYTDPELIDKLIMQYEKTNPDVIDMKGFPFGFRSVGFTPDSLSKICSIKKTNITDTHYRAFLTELNLFNLEFFENVEIINFNKELRFTLDYPEDLKFAQLIFKNLGNDFNLSKLINFCEENNDFIDITKDLDKKWKVHYDDANTNFSTKLN
jgi:spore coat polysaccharide biosynthesis protein SpsF